MAWIISIGLFIVVLINDKPSMDTTLIASGIFAVAGALSYIGTVIKGKTNKSNTNDTNE